MFHCYCLLNNLLIFYGIISKYNIKNYKGNILPNFIDQYFNTKSIFDLAKTNKLNNNLLIPIHVQKMVEMAKYNIKLGNRELITKSFIELEEWTKYWGELSNDEQGSIKISNIQKKPSILQQEKFPIAFDLINLEKIFSLDDSIGYIKGFILDNIISSSNKDEFLFLSNLLLSMNFDVLSIPFIYNNTYNMLQMKKDVFVITTNHLGPIRGVFDDTNSTLFLKVCSKICIKPIEDTLKDKLGHIKLTFQVSNEIPLLFEFKNNALSLNI